MLLVYKKNNRYTLQQLHGKKNTETTPYVVLKMRIYQLVTLALHQATLGLPTFKTISSDLAG